MIFWRVFCILVNGALAAVATPHSLQLSMTKGFGFTLLVGAAAYGLCLVLLALVRPWRAE